MRKFTLLFAMLLAVTFVNAQDIKFGAKAGVNFATLTGDVDDAKMLTGLHIGGLVNIGINDKFSIQPELMFSRQGVKQEATVLGTEIKSTTKLNYLNIPIMAQYEVAKGFRLEAGPQLGFFMGGKAKVETSGTTNNEVEVDLDSDSNETIDFGLGFGASYQTEMGLLFGGRYNLGLSNISKSDDATAKNGVIQLSVGYVF